MADPATQFQSAGLNVPYQYTPVETRLNPPIHLDPVNYDAISRAFSGLTQQIQQGPLNPAVRAQMQAETARYNLTKDIIGDVDKLPPDQRRRVTGVGAQGAEIIPGYQTGNWNPTGTPQNVNPNPENTTNNPEQNNPPQNNAPQNNQPTTDNQPAGNVTGQPSSSGQQFGGSSGGTGTQQQFKEPQSPYGPANNQAPAAPGQQQNRNQPTAPTQQPIVQNQPIYQPGAGDQQQLTAWQNQNAHPVMSAQDALAWAKRFNTGIKHAVYMPNGGPMNQPAFAFSDGKSNNLVPLSQIVQNGGGPLVAGQNTSQVLNVASSQQQGQQPQGQPQPQGPQVAQQPQPQQPQGQQQPQQQQPQGPQLAQNQPPPAPITANTPLSPDEKAYIASQGDVGVLAADTSNQWLLKANADINRANGQTQLAPNTIRDNVSNTPRSTDPTHSDPVPPGQQPGQQAQWPMQQLTKAQAAAGGLNSLKDGDDPGQKVLGRDSNGLQWFVDTQPPDSKNPDSHLPYLVTQTSPWSERRMYNPVGNEWIPVEVTRPDRVLDQQLMNLTHQDSTGWKDANGQPDTARKINELRRQYNIETTNPMPGPLNDKLESLRSQVINSQRIMDLTQHMTPNDWGWFRQFQNNLRENSNAFAGMPFADKVLKAAAQKIAPGNVNGTLQNLVTAYGTLMRGQNDPNLTPEERGELDHIPMGTQLSDKAKQLNYSRMQEFNRYVNQGISDRYRISDDHLGFASQITSNRRVSDPGAPSSAMMTSSPTGYSPTVMRAQPVVAPAAPTPTPAASPAATPVTVPPNNSQKAPMNLSGARADQINQAKRLPRGTWVQSGNNPPFQIP